MANDYPGGASYQSPGLPPMAPFPTPFPADLGAFGPLAYMGAQQMGLLPQSLMNFSFTPSTDIWTQFQAIQQFQARTTAMQAATRGDVQSLIQYQRSIARASGADWSRLEGRAGRAANWVGDMLPILSMIMPETVDTIMGPRGSQTVMASQMANAGRFMFDSATGRMGLTGSETGAMTNALYQQLYGTDAATASMRGIGAGRAGILMNEMLARGLTGGNLLQSPEAMQVGGAAGLLGGGAAGTGLAGMGRLSPDAISRQGEQLKGMVKIISAISDMFGANGQPNAPIPQILAALDQLGSGMEYRYSSGQVENTFRQLQQATVSGRISLPRMSQLVGQNSALLASMGLDPREAIGLSTQAVNFTSGAMSAFQGNFYGKMSPDQLNAVRSQLGAAAEASPAGQMASIALYLDASGTGLQAGSEFKQIVEAIRSGQTTYGNGKSVREVLQGGGLRDIYRAAGGNVINFDTVAMNPGAAARYGESVRTAITKMHPEELGAMAKGSLSAVLGVDDVRTSQKIMSQVFEAAPRLLGLSDELRFREIEKIADAAMGATPGTSLGKGGAIWASLDGVSRDFGGNRSLEEALQAVSPIAARTQDQLDRQNKISGALAGALGDLGRGSFAQRFTNELMNLKPGEGFGAVLGRVIGGVDKNAIGAALAKRGALGTDIDATLKKIQSGTATAEETAALKDQLSTAFSALQHAGIDVEKIAGQQNAASLIGSSLSPLGGLGNLGVIGAGSNPLGAVSDAGSGGGMQKMLIELTGTLRQENDGTMTIVGTGQSEGPATGAKK